MPSRTSRSVALVYLQIANHLLLRWLCVLAFPCISAGKFLRKESVHGFKVGMITRIDWS